MGEGSGEGDQFINFRMVGTIAIPIALALTNHSKNQTILMLNFKMPDIPICLIFQCSVFKPPLYSKVCYVDPVLTFSPCNHLTCVAGP